jgi:hypothetical protein
VGEKDSFVLAKAHGHGGSAALETPRTKFLRRWKAIGMNIYLSSDTDRLALVNSYYQERVSENNRPLLASSGHLGRWL